MINRIRDLKPGIICQIQLNYFSAQLKGGRYESMSDHMKFIILSIKDEIGTSKLKLDNRKEIKFLHDGKIYTTWLAGDIKVLEIK